MNLGSLEDIGFSYGTDKSSLIHDYLKKYQKYLPFDREAPLSILEIGVLDGASLRTWRDYYTNAQILGLDVDPKCAQHVSTRIQIEIGSQTDGDFLTKVSEQYGPFDLIIDDGSHINSDIIFTFNQLFNYLKSGGVYIVEDTSTSYWPEYGGDYNSQSVQRTTVGYFATLLDDVNYHGIKIPNEKNYHRRKDADLDRVLGEDRPMATKIDCLSFLNSLILIHKK